MKVIIEFSVDNAAFTDAAHLGGVDGVREEVGHVLARAVDTASAHVAYHMGVLSKRQISDALLDTNGNTVGTVRIEQ